MSPPLDEQWQDIAGYLGAYMVSDHGRVKSVARVNARGQRMIERIMRQQRAESGHMFIRLCRDGVATSHTVHSLVLEAFVGPRPDGTEALHADDVPDHNWLGNLRWGTRSENMFDRVRNGIHNQAVKTHCPRGHELVGDNVRAKDATHGKRDCRSCAIERAAAWREQRSFDPHESDQIYQEVLRGDRPFGRRKRMTDRRAA